MGGQKGKPDFRVRKAKVGKRLPTAHVPNLSFSWTTLNLSRGTGADGDDAASGYGLQSHAGFSVADALKSCRNHAAATRKEGLAAVRNLLGSDAAPTAAAALVASSAGDILLALAERLGDDDAGVRSTLFSVLADSLASFQPADIVPFLPILLARCEAALCKPHVDIRLDALACVAVLVEAHPSLCSRVTAALADTVCGLLDARLHTLVARSVIGAVLPPGYGLNSSSGAARAVKVTAIDARIAVAFVLRRLLLGGFDNEEEATTAAATAGSDGGDDGQSTEGTSQASCGAAGLLLLPVVLQDATKRIITMRRATLTPSCAASFAVGDAAWDAVATRRGTGALAASSPEARLTIASGPACDALAHLLTLWADVAPDALDHAAAHDLHRLSLLSHVGRLLAAAADSGTAPDDNDTDASERILALVRAPAREADPRAAKQSQLPHQRAALIGRISAAFPAELDSPSPAVARALVLHNTRAAEALLALLPSAGALTTVAAACAAHGGGNPAAVTVAPVLDVAPANIFTLLRFPAPAAPPVDPTPVPAPLPPPPVPMAGNKRRRVHDAPPPVDRAAAVPAPLPRADAKRLALLQRGVAAAVSRYTAVATWLEAAMEAALPAAAARVSAAAQDATDVPPHLPALPALIALSQSLHTTLRHLAGASLLPDTADAPQRVFNGFVRLFHACHPLSPAKLRGVHFASHALLQHVTSGPSLEESVVSDWLRALPRLLWQLGTSSLHTSAQVLDVLHDLARRTPPASPLMAQLHDGVRQLTPLLYATRSLPGSSAASAASVQEGVYGPFRNLPLRLQQLVVDVLSCCTSYSPPLERAMLVLSRCVDTVPTHIRMALLRAVVSAPRRHAEAVALLDTSVLDDEGATSDLARSLAHADVSARSVPGAAWMHIAIGKVHALLLVQGATSDVLTAADAGVEGVLPALLPSLPLDALAGTLRAYKAIVLEELAGCMTLPSPSVHLPLAWQAHVDVLTCLQQKYTRACEESPPQERLVAAAMLLSYASAWMPWIGADASISRTTVGAFAHAMCSMTASEADPAARLVVETLHIAQLLLLCVAEDSSLLAQWMLAELVSLGLMVERGDVARGALQLLSQLCSSEVGRAALKAHRRELQPLLDSATREPVTLRDGSGDVLRSVQAVLQIA